MLVKVATFGTETLIGTLDWLDCCFNSWYFWDDLDMTGVIQLIGALDLKVGINAKVIITLHINIILIEFLDEIQVRS